MSTYDYMTPGEAFAASRDGVADWQTIIGRKGADASWLPRSRAGIQRKPEHTWEARRYMDKNAMTIARVVRTSEDGMEGESEPGSLTVFFEGGTHTYLHTGDLLCVERPIGV